MLDVMKALVKRSPDSKMLFVGDGAMRTQILEKRKALGLDENVILTGVRTDTAALLQGMDLFLFPSKYEGLPIALVEAQCSGLPCLLSDAIPRDVDVTPLIHRLPLTGSPAEWADKIIELTKEPRRAPDYHLFTEKGFDIKEMVKCYEELA